MTSTVPYPERTVIVENLPSDSSQMLTPGWVPAESSTGTTGQPHGDGATFTALRMKVQFSTMPTGAEATDFEPDLDTPRTIAQLASEQREFLESIDREYVDIDLP